MYLGKIVELAGTEELFGNPMHPYTEELLMSAPKLKPEPRRREIVKGDVPSPIDIPPGCPFHPRCPRRFDPCDKDVPESREAGGRLVSCHLFSS
jgi:oligopeptide/dipeptide ABC transporter ATP-binding protein